MNKTIKAILFSLILHLALFAALASLRPAFDLGTGASATYMQIALVDATDPDDSNSVEPDSADLVETNGAREAENFPDEPPAPPAQTERRLGPDRTPPTEQFAESRPENSAAALPQAPSPADVSAADNPSATEVTATVATNANPVRMATPDNRPLPVPEPTVQVHQATIAKTEAALLEEHIDEISKSLAAPNEPRSSTAWEHGDNTYTATVVHQPSGNSSGYDEAIVTISTERDGRSYSTQVRMQRLGFSHYAQFVDRWDPQIRIHNDEIDGRFHSNSDILIQRSQGVQPTFLGKVTTARSVDTSQSDRSINRDQVFRGGLETRVGRISLPGRIALFDENSPDPGRILELDADTRLQFLADGSYTWSAIMSRREARRSDRTGKSDSELTDPTEGRGKLPDGEPFYFVAAEGAKLYLSGTLNGQVLVYSPADIVIEGNLIYATHPIDSANSDDYLGLVSDSNVAIAAPSVTGLGDLEIHAAIYARLRFAVRGFRSRPSGELKVIGSLTAGSLTATEPRYSTRLVFDNRLAEVRPPQFPVTDRYEVTAWNGRWTFETPINTHTAAYPEQ